MARKKRAAIDADPNFIQINDSELATLFSKTTNTKKLYVEGSNGYSFIAVNVLDNAWAIEELKSIRRDAEKAEKFETAAMDIISALDYAGQMDNYYEIDAARAVVVEELKKHFSE